MRRALASHSVLSAASYTILATIPVMCWADLPLQVKEAALAEGWEEAWSFLAADDSQAMNPVARLVAAHACLATNRDNDALILFLSLREPEAVGACVEWTRTLADQHRDSAVAHYLAGDALARAGNHQEAIASFGASLQIDGRFALAMSARGVAKAVTGDVDGALLDLHQATQLAPDVADLHANLGVFWVLQNAAPGAVEAFSRALAINPSFALAYNGRGCARFGQGDYDGAIQDLEKAFGLCPALLPAGANEAVILAALAAEATPEPGSERPGSTIVTKSELANVDLASLNGEQRTAFHESVLQLADNDCLDALRVCGSQLGGLAARRRDLGVELQRVMATTARAADAESRYHAVDQFLKWMPVIGPRTSLVPEPKAAWGPLLDLGGQVSGTAADAATPGTPAAVGAAIGERILTPEVLNPLGRLKALGRIVSGVPAQGFTAIRQYGQRQAVSLCAQLQSVNAQEGDLRALQQAVLTKGLQQGVDFGRPGLLEDVLGVRGVRPGVTSTTPLREYRIPATAPVTAFGVLPGATGKTIAPPGQGSFVLVEGADLTDPIRLGTALRGYEAVGAQTIPVPKGIGGAEWAKTLGLSPTQTIVTKITSDPAQTYVPPRTGTSSAIPPGGVSTDMSAAHIDRGKWPVMTCFTLAYGVGATEAGTE